MKPQSVKFLFIIALLLVCIVLGLFVLLLLSRSSERRIPTSIVPTSLPTQKGQKDIDRIPLNATINPTYIEKIKREPFWEMLPYYGPHYKVEYKGSDNYILITTSPTNTQTKEYQQEALGWLTANGANLSTLTIKYKTQALY